MGTYSAIPTTSKAAKLKGLSGKRYAQMSTKDGHVTVIDRKIYRGDPVNGWKKEFNQGSKYEPKGTQNGRMPKDSTNVGGVADINAAWDVKKNRYQYGSPGSGQSGWKSIEEAGDKNVLILGVVVALALML